MSSEDVVLSPEGVPINGVGRIPDTLQILSRTEKQTMGFLLARDHVRFFLKPQTHHPRKRPTIIVGPQIQEG